MLLIISYYLGAYTIVCRIVRSSFPFSNMILNIHVLETTSSTEAYENMLVVKAKWSKKYPISLRTWDEHWDEVSAIF